MASPEAMWMIEVRLAGCCSTSSSTFGRLDVVKEVRSTLCLVGLGGAGGYRRVDLAPNACGVATIQRGALGLGLRGRWEGMNRLIRGQRSDWRIRRALVKEPGGLGSGERNAMAMAMAVGTNDKATGGVVVRRMVGVGGGGLRPAARAAKAQS